MGCPRCGWLNRAGAEFCANCGAQLVTPASEAEREKEGQPPAPGLGAAAAMPVAPAAAILPGLTLPQAQPPPPAPPSRPRATDDARPYLPMSGPADRETFFDAMRRHRRATWRVTTLCALAAIFTGIPLSLVITPVLFSVIVAGTALVNALVSVPAGVWDFYDAILGIVIHVFEQFDDANPAKEPLTAGDIALAAAVWLAPGIALMLLVWPAIRELFDNVGVGVTLLALGAREPRPGDPEERQLVNVVEEMAIAAGLPAPRVMLIDSYVANAAVVGSSPRDATLIVSRPLIDDLDRGETQGVLANLIASVGNGDLGIAQSMIAVFQTFGFVTAFLKAPVSGRARRTLWRMLRFTLGRRSSPTRAADAERLTRDLTGGIGGVEGDDFDALNPQNPVRPRRGPQLEWIFYLPPIAIGVLLYGVFNDWDRDLIRTIIIGLAVVGVLIVLYQIRYLIYLIGRLIVTARLMVMLPYYLAVMMPQFLLMLFSSFILEPMMGRVWRTRRFLADATAVQLTRNPDWVADGLLALVRRGGVIPGGKWATPLFIVGPEAAHAQLMTPEAVERTIATHDRMAAALASRDIVEMQQAALAAAGEPAGPATDTSVFGMSGGMAGFHPKVNDRLKRLRKLGAGVDPEASERAYEAAVKAAMRRRRAWWHPFIMVLVVLLLAIAAVLMVVVVVLLTGLSLLFTSFMMLIPYALLELLRP